MQKKNFTNISKPALCLIFIQLLIIASVLLFWLLHRGNAFQGFFTAEDYIFLADADAADTVVIDESSGFDGIFIQTPPQSLRKGIYQLQLYYFASSDGNTLSVSTEQLEPLSLHCSELELNPGCHIAATTLELSRGVTDLTINISFSGSGSLSIVGLSLAETSGRCKKACFYALLLCLLLNVLYVFRKSNTSSRAVMLALTGIFAVSCYPLYTDYLPVGHDLPFHLLRIEGIADGLSSGIFPVKIHPVWAKDYGYAVGVLYGDLLLYFPAFLRLLGFSVQSAYKLFAAAVNLGTVLTSYFCFKRIFGSRKIGLCGSLIYTLSYYRLADTYTRAAVGEYTAMLFLPLVLLGFYLIFAEPSKENWRKHGILTAFGLTGLIQTHILSCEMTGFVIILLCLLLLPKVFRKYTFLSLLEGALLTLLINVGFLVPFLEFYSSGLAIGSPEWSGKSSDFFQAGGLFPVQLFTVFQNSTGGSWSTGAGIANEATYGLGIVFFFVIALYIYLLACHYEKCRGHRCFKAASLCTALGCLLAFMSTCYFPWDAIAAWGSAAETLVFSLQFPWRVLELSTALLTFSGCFVLSVLSASPNESDTTAAETAHLSGGRFPIGNAALIGMLILMTVNIGWYMFDLLYTQEPYRVYNTCDLNTMALYSGEYLPEGTDPQLIRDNFTHWENVGGVEAYTKHGTNIRCDIIAAESGGFVDFPLIGYRHYRCIRTDTGEQLPVGTGYNNMLRVTFPSAFEGTIEVSFREPWYWRLSEAVSVLTAAICLLLTVLRSSVFVQNVYFKKAEK